jgi:hypothetical protein
MLTRALWWLIRNGLILIGMLLAADLLAVVLVLPTGLLGPAVGLPITVGLLGFGGFTARKLMRKRESAARRQRRLDEKQARRHRKEQRWLEKLQWLEIRPDDQIDYREAASDLGFYGYAGGLTLYAEALIVALPIWPERMKSLPMLLICGGLLLAGLVGFAVVVLYAVHLHHHVQALRRRRLRRRLDRRLGGRLGHAVTAGSASGVGHELTAPFQNVGSLGGSGDWAESVDAGGSDSGDS